MLQKVDGGSPLQMVTMIVLLVAARGATPSRLMLPPQSFFIYLISNLLAPTASTFFFFHSGFQSGVERNKVIISLFHVSAVSETVILSEDGRLLDCCTA